MRSAEPPLSAANAASRYVYVPPETFPGMNPFGWVAKISKISLRPLPNGVMALGPRKYDSTVTVIAIVTAIATVIAIVVLLAVVVVVGGGREEGRSRNNDCWAGAREE